MRIYIHSYVHNVGQSLEKNYITVTFMYNAADTIEVLNSKPRPHYVRKMIETLHISINITA